MCGLHKHQLGVWKSKARFKERDREQKREHIYGPPQTCGDLTPLACAWLYFLLLGKEILELEKYNGDAQLSGFMSLERNKQWSRLRVFTQRKCVWEHMPEACQEMADGD